MNALIYASLCVIIQPQNAKKEEFMMGLFGGSFDMISSSLLGIAFANGPSDLVQALVLVQCVVQVSLQAVFFK